MIKKGRDLNYRNRWSLYMKMRIWKLWWKGSSVILLGYWKRYKNPRNQRVEIRELRWISLLWLDFVITSLFIINKSLCTNPDPEMSITSILIISAYRKKLMVKTLN